ncbi:MAG TPA: hypothetical protein VNE39_08820 [Planctomycetota bacterium]|nr:hypothetical protein [Planctomycetota bacterium]
MAKSKPRESRLVCRHLERVSGLVMEQYRDILRESFRRANGIYALYKGRRLYYVGLASNLASRLVTHLRDRHAGKWDSFSLYETSSDKHIRELEALVVRITEPRANQVKGKLQGSADLRKELEGRIRARNEDHLSQMFGHAKRERRQATPAPARPAKSKLPMAGLIEGGWIQLRFTHRGTEHKALLAKNGTITFNGEVFASPSLAARKAAGKTAYNGWKAWKYKNQAGEWRYIDELRKKE